MVFLDHLQLEEVRLVLNSFQDERDVQASLLDPPDECLGRRELMLSDLVTPKENLQDSIESEDFLKKIQIRYTKHSAWTNILQDPELFSHFKIQSRFILHLNDFREPHLVLPDVIHKGERIAGIAIKNAHKILGHLGFQKTLEHIRKYYWWPTMVKDTEKFISSCETCQTTKWTTQRMPGLLHQLPIPDAPWTSIAMDFVGPFPKNLDSNYLWVIVCQLTSQVHLVPIKTTTNALDLAYEFLKNVVHLHRLPKSIVSNQDSKFTSKFWTKLHHLLGVRLKMTTSFHPQGDGQAEQMIQMIIQIIQATICPDQHDWVLQLPMIEFALNSSTNKSTRYAPFKLIYRQMPQMTITLPPTNLPGVEAFAQCTLDQHQGAHDTIIKSEVDQLVQVNKHQ